MVIVIGGGDVTLGAAFGLMTVLGIAVRNGLMLMRHLQELENGEPERLDQALVVRGTADRAAPVALTALATAAVMLPFAVLGDVAGNEITHSTAAVVMGGLVTSTALTLFVLPALYLHLARGLAGRARRPLGGAAGGAGPRPAARNLITEGESTCCTGNDGWRARRSSPPSRSPAAARRRRSTTRPPATRGRRGSSRSRAATSRASILTAQAAQRIGIATSRVRATRGA